MKKQGTILIDLNILWRAACLCALVIGFLLVPCLDKNNGIELPDVKPPAIPKIHNIPDALTDTDGIHIEWDANTEEDLAGYKVYRSTNADKEYKLIDTLSKATVFYEDTDVRVETKYYYRVTAVDENGNESNMSQTISYTLLHKAVLMEPPNQSVVRTASPIFKWLEVNNAQSYVVRVFVNTEDKTTPWREVWKSHEVVPLR